MKLSYYLIILILFLSTTIAHAATLNVPSQYATIQAAIDASGSGDTIQIAAGTYTEAGTTTISISSKTNLTLNGAGATSTIIRGQDTNKVFEVGDSSTGITFSNMTIRNGNGNGGISFSANCSGTLTNCIVSNNAGDEGGGLRIQDASSVTINNCTISSNTATTSGAGLLIIGDATACTVTVTNSTITGNTTGGGIDLGGAAAHNLTMTSCTLSNNTDTTGGNGGAINAGSNTPLTLNRCSISGNTASSEGGGISAAATSTITNCLFTSNTGTSGSAIRIDGGTATITNCTLSGNTATTLGGASISCAAGSTTTLRNTIIANGSADDLGTYSETAGILTIQNCDYYNNPYGLHGEFLTMYTTVSSLNALSNADGNYALDPLFVNAGAGNYRLLIDSPCINTGTTTGAPSVDIEGTARPQGYGPDIGCYEFIAPGATTAGEAAAAEVTTTSISGSLYDSATGTTLSNADIKIYNENGTLADSTFVSSPYSLTVTKGNKYFIRVIKEGYTFPSTTTAGTTAGDHGEVFTASANTISMNLYLDPGYPIELDKTANKKEATAGDIITYNLRLKNKSTVSVEDIVVSDDIVNGFKYISESAYLGASQLTVNSVQFTGRNGTFTVGSIPGDSTVNLSYQVRVSTGVVPGTYKSTAVSKTTPRNWQMSNISTAQVEIVEDAFFDKGTIIGKVFLDLNANGIQDREKPETSNQGKQKPVTSNQKPETGIPGVRIATEYGVVVTTDKNGKYHIPAVSPGVHLVKIDMHSLPNGAKLTTENPYVVRITPGLLSKVNFGLKAEEKPVTTAKADQKPEKAGKAETRESRKQKPVTRNQGKQKPGKAETTAKADQKPEDYFFLVALGEGILRNLNTSGNIEMVGKDDSYEDGLRLDGRLSLYLKGKIKGKYLVTAGIDTERNKKELFTNLDPDKYYPIYGDASVINYDANDTQDEFFLLVEMDKSHIKWGSFHTDFTDTDIAVYNRTLQGVNVVYESVGKTAYDDPWTKLKGFWAKARQLPAHDEFLGTGGSLYYMRHRDIIEGSEKLKVEIRDQTSNIVLYETELKEEIDYEIDYQSGRILLTRPLNSVTYNYHSSIISNDILNGNRIYLVIDYEYKPTETMKKDSWGVRGSQQLGKHIRVGGIYVEEQKPVTSNQKDYELKGIDGTVKLTKTTEITGEYAQSRNTTQTGGNYSIDGGLTFDGIANTVSDGKTGDAWTVKGKTELFKNTNLTGFYTTIDEDFSSIQLLSQEGTQKYGGSIVTKLTDNLTLAVKHITQELKNGASSLSQTISKNLLSADKNHTTSALLDYTRDKLDFRAEYQHREINDPVTDFEYLGLRNMQDNDFIGSRIGYQLKDWLHPYIGGQLTLSGKTNNQGYIGTDLKLWKNTALNLKETIGNLGDSTLVGLTRKVSDETDIYATLETGRDSFGEKLTKTTWGEISQIDRDTKVYTETDYSSYNENVLQGKVLGYETQVNDNFGFGLSYERANIERLNSAISRDSGSAALNYLNTDRLKLFSKLELRNDRNDRSTSLTAGTERQWLTQNNMTLYLTKDLSLLGRLNWSTTRDHTNDNTQAKFHEIGTGLAYRPVNFDRLNLLGKYSYITDMGPLSQNDFAETTNSRKHIYGMEGAFDICRYLQLLGKFGLRDMEEKAGTRDWVSSDTYLYIARTNFHITQPAKSGGFSFTKGWDLSGEYRILDNPDTEDTKSGWLVELDKEIIEYARLGVGYNFTDFDDDLSNDDYDAEGWYVRMIGKY